MSRRSSTVAILVVLIGSLFVTGHPRARTADDYIVVLRTGVRASDHARGFDVRPKHVYGAAINGYAAQIDRERVPQLRSDPLVERVDRDNSIAMDRWEASGTPAQPAQMVSSAIERVGGLDSPTADIDGTDERVDIDVAILDTGIQPDHPDLNVVGGKNCSEESGWEDEDGHGTFIGGLIGAIDNGIGHVGVAPGARLWSVRLSDRGRIPLSAALCAFDWVARHADVIDVANMSFVSLTTDRAADRATCARSLKDFDAFHRAFCGLIRRGVTAVAGAGNSALNAGQFSPANFPDAIAVSAMVDTDGQPGGLGEPVGVCVNVAGSEDDTFGFFSNYGKVVDLAAPGVCVESTFLNGTYALSSGTSFAAPIVTGAAALYLANNPDATPEEVRTALIALRELGPLPGDPDGVDEGVVDVSTL